MATHSSTLAWKISLMEKPGRLQFMGLQKVRHDRATSHSSKVMLKILQAKLQQYVNCEIADVQAGFRKGRVSRDQIANIPWIIKNAREFQKKYLFLPYWLCKAFDCVDHNKLWKILKEMGIPDHLTCLLRNLYAGQEATVSLINWKYSWNTVIKQIAPQETLRIQIRWGKGGMKDWSGTWQWSDEDKRESVSCGGRKTSDFQTDKSNIKW